MAYSCRGDSRPEWWKASRLIEVGVMCGSRGRWRMGRGVHGGGRCLIS